MVNFFLPEDHSSAENAKEALAEKALSKSTVHDVSILRREIVILKTSEKVTKCRDAKGKGAVFFGFSRKQTSEFKGFVDQNRYFTYKMLEHYDPTAEN